MVSTGGYCRAYHARELAAFPGWRPDVARLRPAVAEDGRPLPGTRDALRDDDILYLQEDLTVTDGIFRDENVVFADAGHEWRAFCEGVLGFAPPTDAHREPAAAGS